MRIFCITSEAPYPINHGARVDIWNRYTLLRQLGFRMMLATWSPHPLSPQEVSALETLFDDVEVNALTRSVGSLAARALHLPWHSPHVSSRFLPPARMQETCRRVSAFGADLVILEEPYGAALARRVADTLDLPLFYRSHNIEFRYMRGQARQAAQWGRKLAWRLASLHLEGLEFELQRSAEAVFDISADDADYWRARGVARTHWLPTLFAKTPSAHIDWADRPYDIVFLGNLNTPNNLAGLTWFVRDVLPILRRRRTDLRICIAGSKPTSAIRRVLTCEPDIDLVCDPPDAEEIWSGGRVLINPALSGSGMNVKAGEMLFYDSPLVTTTMGVRGFADSIRDEFLVADTPHAFADRIAAALAQPGFDVSKSRLSARGALGPSGIETMVDILGRGDRRD